MSAAGELSDALKAQAASLGIAERCVWHGAQPQKAVFAALARADLFVLASKKAADGDQDGLPNVLMEAAHQGLPLVSTQAAAIGEFIEDGETGLLVPPAAPRRAGRGARHALIARSRAARAAWPQRAGEIVRTRFSYEAGVDWIAVGAWQGRRLPVQQSRHRRAPRSRPMRVLLHTPLKPPDSPVPSGDREMARGLARLLRRLGHQRRHAAAQPRGAGRAAARRASRAGAARARRRPRG